MHFELIYNGNCKWSKRLEDLQHLAKSIEGPWEIHMVVKSKIGLILNEYEIFGLGGIKSVVEQLDRGIGKNVMVKKYNISLETLNKYIRLYNQFENENPV